MHYEQNNSFADRLIQLYSAAGLPAATLNRDFSVRSYSDAAHKLLPYLTAPDGAKAFFALYGIESIKAEIAARGSFSSQGTSLFGGCALTLCALGDEDDAYLLLPAVQPVSSGVRPEGALRTIGTFDAQYRTQLHMLFSALGNASRALAPDATDHLHAGAYLEQANQSAFTLLRSCEWVSAYARLSHGLTPLKPVRVELYSWLRRLFASAGGMCAERGVPLSVSLPKGDLFVLCDVERLTDVLANLLSNACRFTRAGNHIEIRVRKVDENKLSFSVKDFGFGIPNAIQPRVFEPYYSFDRGGNPFGGNGLGLAIVQDTVALLGGTVKLTSTDGEGTTVLFTLSVQEDRSSTYAGESDIPDYLTDRFSPLHIALADCPPVSE